MTSAHYFVFAWIVGGAAVACTHPVDGETLRAEVLQVDKEWAAAAANADLERIVSNFSEDAILVPPDAPPLIGRDDIRAFVAEAMQAPGFSMAWEATQAGVADSGDIAFTVGRSLSTVNGPDGEPVSTTGNYVAVWRKERSGAWRCVFEIGNRDPSATEFLQGLNVGYVDLAEGKIVEAVGTIRLLEEEEGERIDRVVALKKQRINVDLFTLSVLLEKIDGVADWPMELQVLVEMKSSNMKTFFRRLRRARLDGDWEHSDPAQEKAIQKVFDVYEEFGNLLRIKSS